MTGVIFGSFFSSSPQQHKFANIFLYFKLPTRKVSFHQTSFSCPSLSTAPPCTTQSRQLKIAAANKTKKFLPFFSRLSGDRRAVSCHDKCAPEPRIDGLLLLPPPQ
jgi:hypothetical protein